VRNQGCGRWAGKAIDTCDSMHKAVLFPAVWLSVFLGIQHGKCLDQGWGAGVFGVWMGRVDR